MELAWPVVDVVPGAESLFTVERNGGDFPLQRRHPPAGPGPLNRGSTATFRLFGLSPH